MDFIFEGCILFALNYYNFQICLQSQLKCFFYYFVTIFHHNMFRPLLQVEHNINHHRKIIDVMFHLEMAHRG
jgi:hypothetical protein